MKSKRFTIGTDPEFFLRDKNTGKMVSAIPYVEGTKHEPVELPSGGTVQRDNVALEFATPPAKDTEDFVLKVRNALMDVAKALPPHLKLETIPSADFDEKELKHPEACEFGCSPDFDAWKLIVNPPPSARKTFRSCGAHIHVGHVEGDGNDFLLEPLGKVYTIRLMDLFHGVISTILDNSEEAIERRKLYGKAGSHRPTEYGVEYRALSNYWMKSPELVMLMDRLTEDVLRIMRDTPTADLEDIDKGPAIIKEVGEVVIQDIINEGYVDRAKDILENVLSKHLSAETKELLDMCMEKIETYDVVKEWSL